VPKPPLLLTAVSLYLIEPALFEPSAVGAAGDEVAIAVLPP
jgi:hypothetical protein